ncbi:biotin/lipoyl-containing protein [Paracoccus sulfuroxidans]|uniref:2-oxoglutarate dehydrogenase E2 component (Dihydrolipoamide succinyltransferase)/2-oxoisovalerate dehydrogenase E2 component (Dihydrolipoyl transacylase) n=1 Tax=Paracoccus sulfuroxidans TaxID=384678 RepID=A0A562NUW0_9RHOB|nr:biotin/lipoyl-containing protein [Paracoccus sulfuroxidans]TWI35982.1 2-oxoglutarate dehydrogenase E2 component (dihydrolipoamide succinyltransferase)/2-oxoisovalerate dehydrogenase E2 component (dihydrolipoyl transacylase) [Paracoccus sulfuroxidans]
MIVDFPLPELGEQVSSATVTGWMKAPGDQISKDELMLEVMTEKINVEVVSPYDGKLVEILADIDADVSPGVIVARIEIAD